MQQPQPRIEPVTRPRAQPAAKRVLNAGSGPLTSRRLHAMFKSGAWREVRLDIDPAARSDVVGSITDMHAHFPERSFDAVWSSHCVEHLHAHEVAQALAEFRRVLKPDGFALITCPDLETVIALALERGMEYVAYESAIGPITPLDMLFGHSASIAAGQIHMAHKSGFTAARLGQVLLDAGFGTVYVKRQGLDLWALALMLRADADAVRRELQAAGLDLHDDPE
jgi:SAM-dependent methyltransferase